MPAQPELDHLVSVSERDARIAALRRKQEEAEVYQPCIYLQLYDLQQLSELQSAPQINARSRELAARRYGAQPSSIAERTGDDMQRKQQRLDDLKTALEAKEAAELKSAPSINKVCSQKPPSVLWLTCTFARHQKDFSDL